MSTKAILYLMITLFFWGKSLKKPYLGLCFFAAIVFIRPETIAYYQLDFLRISLATAVVCFIGFVLNKNSIGPPVRTNLLTLFFIFCLMGYTSTYFAEMYSDYLWPETYMKLFVFCFLITRLINDIKKFELFILAALLGIAFLAIWGVDQHFRGNVRLDFVGGDRFGSNELGSIWAMVTPLFLFKALGKISIFTGKKKMFEQVFFAGLIVFLVLAIVYSSSRGAFLGLATGVCFMLFKSTKKFKTTMIAILLLPIIFSFLPADYVNRISTIFNPSIAKEISSSQNTGDSSQEEVDGSIKGRLDFWKAAVQMIKDFPFLGVGLQNFELLTPEYTEGVYGRKDTHNTYLKIAAETGIASIIIFLSMILITYMNFSVIRKNCLPQEDEKNFFYQYALEAGLTGFLVCSLTGSYNYTEPFYWFLFLSASLREISFKSGEMKEV